MHEGRRGRSSDTFRARLAVEPAIATDQRDRCAEKEALDDAANEVPGSDEGR